MRIVRDLATLREARADLAAPVGLVPTMGYLHAGHESLMQRAREECSSVLVTLFVNPTQFGPGEDFERYPRDFERDRAICESQGADLLYAPPTEEVYPRGFATAVDVGGLTDRWEGEYRPGHFRGVATIVAKLLNATAADQAYFGEKDYQQLQVVTRMARDLDIPTRIVGCPTIREPDGLALSSRNAYLTPAERPRAAAIHRGLRAARDACQNGVRDAERLKSLIVAEIEPAGLRLDYAAIVDPVSFETVTAIDRPARALVAARLGAVRLIDNLAIEPPG